jgi:hypothetical protein
MTTVRAVTYRSARACSRAGSSHVGERASPDRRIPGTLHDTGPKLRIFVLLVCLVSVISGCGSGADQKQKEAAPIPVTPATGEQASTEPDYSGARQDSLVSQPASNYTTLSGLRGTGCYVPTDFGLPVCRLTDSDWDPALVTNTFTPVGSDNNFWSCNHDFIFIASSGGLGYVAALSTSKAPPYMSISHVYPGGADSTHGGWYSLSDSGGWSWNCASTPNLLYLMDHKQAATIDGYDFTGYASNPKGGPATTTVFNFAAGSAGKWGLTSDNCLPNNANAAPGWRELFGTSKVPADGVFEMAFSLVKGINPGIDTVSVTQGSVAFSVAGAAGLDTAGSLTHAQIVIAGTTYAIATVAGDGMSGTLTTPYRGTTGSALPMAIPDDQGTGMDIAIYKPGQGCAHLNVGTGVITSDFGASGIMSTTDRFYLHGARISPDGTYVFLSTDSCVPGTCSSVNDMGYLWNTSSLSVVPLCKNPNFCGGHNADGFTHLVNQGGEFPQSEIRSYGDDSTAENIIPVALGDCTETGVDTHLSWQDVDALDSYPFLISSTAFGADAPPPGSYKCPWIDEVFAVNPVKGTVYRFAHTLITGKSWNYVLQSGIGHVSDDGQYFMFGSDWNGTLGRSDLHSGPCVNSPAGTSACRGDVFMVNLTATPVF